MSKDDFPPTITSEIILQKTFEFIEDWKNKLYDMLSFNTISVMQVNKVYKTLSKLYSINNIQNTNPTVRIKQEPVDEVKKYLNSEN